MENKHKICAVLAAVGLLALPNTALANCYADYKAKQTSGELKLHYGVVQVPDGICSDKGAIADNVRSRISGDGWQLLRVMSSFDETKLNNKRADAGDYFLRY